MHGLDVKQLNHINCIHRLNKKRKNMITLDNNPVKAVPNDASKRKPAAPLKIAPAKKVSAKAPAKKLAARASKAPATATATATTKAAVKVALKTPAKTPVKTIAKPVTKSVTKSAAKPVLKPSTKAGVTESSKIRVPAKPKVEKQLKAKKPKLVRDSFTIPKAEYTVMDDLKQRATKLAFPIKKSELLRAGIKALAAMPDQAFLAALQAVPAIKTGRPSNV
jgi:hypothetical protein